MEPIRFAAEVLALHGAVVEEAPAGGPKRLQALLPDTLAARLGWEEEVALAEETASEGKERQIGYGSADLERLIDLLRDECGVVRVRADAPWPQRRDLGPEAARAFRLHTKVRMTYRATQPSNADYLLVYYALSAVSEETFEGLVPAVVNALTLAPVSGLIPLFRDPQKFQFVEKSKRDGGGHSGADVLRALGMDAERRAIRRLADFIRRLERRRRRDAQRLHRYYEALAQEALTRKRRGRSAGAATAEERLRSIGEEYQRKIRDLDVRYALRIRMRPVAVMQAVIPVLRGTYHLQWRRAERTLAVIWNPLLQDFEPLVCDVCGAAGRTMAISPELCVLCSGCAAATAGKTAPRRAAGVSAESGGARAGV